MKKIILCATLGAALLSGPGALAQRNARWCNTDAHNAVLEATFHDPALAAQRASADALAERLQSDDVFARQFRAQQPRSSNRPAVASRVVPVVVHIITGCGQQTLTEAQVQIGLDQLNADWSFTNSDAPSTTARFMPYAANMDVEFRLAKLDPQGNSFTGIHRVSNVATDAIDPRDLIKTIVPYWDGYFNFWIVDAIASGAGSIPGGTILGYAQFPGNGPWSTWGMVMRSDDWFTPAPLSDGRTATHELGHCFGLYHTFQGGCGTTCATSGDRVCDTPPEATDTYNCNLNQNSCSNDVGPGSPYTNNGPDQIQNHMSYNSCHTLFTAGQKARVDASFATYPYIQNLISPANLTRTGVETGQMVPTPGPVAYFEHCQLSPQGTELVVCAGRPITLTDASYGAPVSGVSWTFTGATPATSTASSPTVTFNTPGRQTITLTPTGPAGPGTPLTVAVRVMQLGQQLAPVVESFENSNQLADSVWRVSSSSPTNSRRWKLTGFPTGVTTDGDTAIVINNGLVPAGTTNALYSPPIDTRTIANTNPVPALTFDMAYSQRSSTSDETLRVSFSANCGQSWTIRRTISGAALSTTGTQRIVNFSPTTLSQWRSESVNLNGQFFNQEAVMVRFESVSNGSSNGNNLYIDNIRLNGRLLVGLAGELASAGVALAPNPMTLETGLRFSLERPTSVTVRVTDVLGRPVLTDAARTLAPGDHQLPLAERLRGAAAGVYVVTLDLDGRPYSQKLLVQ